MSYGTKQPILFIDEIPIGDKKQLEEINGNIEEEFDMPEIESLRKGFDGTFEVRQSNPQSTKYLDRVSEENHTSIWRNAQNV